MTADVIALRERARCAYVKCNRPMVRRSPLNDPAYCCFDHAFMAQPKYALTGVHKGDQSA